MLQFITNENSSVAPSRQILEAIEGGCRWVQIRLKDASDDDIRKLFDEIKDKARETDTTIIINDRVNLVKELGEQGVAGVHLGLKDMSPLEARQMLGPSAIIGVTAHSYDELAGYKGMDIDYVGVGPFAHTATKKDLAPVLGLEGLAEIMLRAKNEGLQTICVAVGGIKLEDVKPLLEIGMNGIAVSGAIANASDIKEETKKFLAELPIDE